jgi:hypothetical protein
VDTRAGGVIDQSWDKFVEEEISSATGRSWVLNLFGLLIMDLRDGSWLSLDEGLLRLSPGTSGRRELLWPVGADIFDILPHVRSDEG